MRSAKRRPTRKVPCIVRVPMVVALRNRLVLVAGLADADQQCSIVASVKVRVWWTKPVRCGGVRVKDGVGNGCAEASRQRERAVIVGIF
jgi:hypothetical protein